MFPKSLARFIQRQRVARLGTADAQGRPQVVPVCFVYDGKRFYIALDAKPKSVPVMQLKRVRNILENPQTTLLLDHYEEDWGKLGYLMVRGRARVIEPGLPEHRGALELLREKYPQYREMALEGRPVVQVTPERYAAWGELGDEG